MPPHGFITREARKWHLRKLSGPSVTRKQVGRGTNRQMPTPTRNTTARDNSSERYPKIYSNICGSAECDVTTETKAQYSAIVLGAAGNVGGGMEEVLSK